MYSVSREFMSLAINLRKIRSDFSTIRLYFNASHVDYLEHFFHSQKVFHHEFS